MLPGDPHVRLSPGPPLEMGQPHREGSPRGRRAPGQGPWAGSSGWALGEDARDRSSPGGRAAGATAGALWTDPAAATSAQPPTSRAGRHWWVPRSSAGWTGTSAQNLTPHSVSSGRAAVRGGRGLRAEAGRMPFRASAQGNGPCMEDASTAQRRWPREAEDGGALQCRAAYLLPRLPDTVALSANLPPDAKARPHPH